jgi:TatD DNase family protein
VFHSLEDLPPLDCHAHIAPDMTAEQLGALGSAQILAMTRSLEEAEYASGRSDSHVTWGCGVHPASESREAFDPLAFGRLVKSFAVVGEVGLDARGRPDQREVFGAILDACADQPVLMSIHSTGRISQVLEMLEAIPQRSAILHWFLGNASDIRRAVAAGCYFSVNAAMSDDQLRLIPLAKLLPETDFPSSRRRTGASLPGDVRPLEERLCRLHESTPADLRHRFYQNLRAITVSSGAIERLPEALAEHLLAA